MTKQLTLIDYELSILREVAAPGSEPGLAWGAAMGEAVEHLAGCGFVRMARDASGVSYVLTDTGLAYLEAHADE